MQLGTFRIWKMLAGGLCAALVTGGVQAADAVATASTWQGEAEFGYVRTAGNTEIENIVLKAKLENERPRWTHGLRFSGIRNEDSGRTTAKNSVVEGETHYRWSERQFGFATARYDQDDFAGYDYRLVATAGIGRKLIHAQDLQLEMEIGAGARRTAYIDTEDVSEGVGRLAGKLTWQISETSALSEEIYSELGEDNTVTDSLTELKVKVIGRLAVKMSLRVTHNTDVPPDTDKTDVKSAVTLVYDFVL